jgi:hypothetical protein
MGWKEEVHALSSRSVLIPSCGEGGGLATPPGLQGLCLSWGVQLVCEDVRSETRLFHPSCLKAAGVLLVGIHGKAVSCMQICVHAQRHKHGYQPSWLSPSARSPYSTSSPTPPKPIPCNSTNGEYSSDEASTPTRRENSVPKTRILLQTIQNRSHTICPPALR